MLLDQEQTFAQFVYLHYLEMIIHKENNGSSM